MDEYDYYNRRAIEEAAAARRSLNPRVRLIHTQLAEGYASKARELEAAGRRSAFRLVTAA